MIYDFVLCIYGVNLMQVSKWSNSLAVRLSVPVVVLTVNTREQGLALAQRYGRKISGWIAGREHVDDTQPVKN